MPPDIEENIPFQNIVISTSYTITISIGNNPTTVTVEGLLEGFVYTFDTSRGELTISGTPTTLRASQMWDITATNSNGTSRSIINYSIVELAPVISSTSEQAFRQGQNVNINLNISNTPSTITAEGYLLGLRHEVTQSGIRIHGRVDSDAVFTVNTGNITITAKNTGGTDTYDLAYGLSTRPVFSDIPDQTFYVGQTVNLDISVYVHGYPPPTFSTETSLPPGLRLSSAGIITGSPTSSLDRTTRIRASNSQGRGTGTIFFMIEPTPIAPNLANIPNQTLNVNSSYSYRLRATGLPTPTFSATNLPDGLTLHEITGLISGTPTTEAVSNVVITASNFNPISNVTNTDSQTVVFNVEEELTVPSIADISDKSFIAGVPITSFTITATGFPDPTFAASNLPQGLSLNRTTGVVSGTPTRSDAGNNNVTITATNRNGNDTETFTITINTVPILPTLINRAFRAQTAISAFTLQANGYPSPNYTATGIPAGINLASSSGRFSGTPERTNYGVNNIDYVSTNVAGIDTDDFNITINTIPIIIDVANMTFVAGTAISNFTVSTTADTYPSASFSVTNLPDGLTLNTSTGIVNGTPDRTDAGINNTVFRSTNSQGADTDGALITINTSPRIPNIPLQGLAVNNAYDQSFTIDAYPAATITVENLPAGLTHTVNGDVLRISGTPTQVEMPNVTITATNSVDTDIHEVVFNVGAAFTVPVLANIPAQTLVAGTEYLYTATSVANPTATYSATNLPDGLSIDSLTGEITGTPSRDDIGQNTVRVIATNHQGSDFQDVVFTVNAIPVMSAITDRTFVAGTSITAFTAVAEAYPAATFSGTMPDGLTLNANTGRVTGTPTRTDKGINDITITANNIIGDDTTSLDITINAIPIITDVTDRTFVAGTAITAFTATADAYPAATFTATNRPGGINVSSAGRFSGTPTRADLGQNTVTIRSTNVVGSDTDTAVFTVNGIPVMAAISDRTFVAGTTITAFTATAEAYPSATFAGDMPDGITLNANTGRITGNPTRTDYGENPITITANNIIGDGTTTFDITINTSPIITAVADMAYTAQTAITPFTLTTSADTFPPATFTSSGLPDGLSLSTAQVSGTPGRTDEGQNTVTFTATNVVDSDTDTAVFTINTIPVIPTLSDQQVVTAVPYTQTWTVDGTSPINITATGLPTGLAFTTSGNTFTLSGTLAFSEEIIGMYSVVITATSSYGSDTETMAINVIDTIYMYLMDFNRRFVQFDSDVVNTALSIESEFQINADTTSTTEYLGLVVHGDDIYYVDNDTDRISVALFSAATGNPSRTLGELPNGFDAEDIRDMDIDGDDLYVIFSDRRVLILNRTNGTEIRRFTINDRVTAAIRIGAPSGIAIHNNDLYFVNRTRPALFRINKNTSNNATVTASNPHALPGSQIQQPIGMTIRDNRIYIANDSFSTVGGNFVFRGIFSFPTGLTSTPSGSQVIGIATPSTGASTDIQTVLGISFDKSV